jgi:hypothetical protein
MSPLMWNIIRTMFTSDRTARLFSGFIWASLLTSRRDGHDVSLEKHDPSRQTGES